MFQKTIHKMIEQSTLLWSLFFLKKFEDKFEDQRSYNTYLVCRGIFYLNFRFPNNQYRMSREIKDKRKLPLISKRLIYH